MYQREKPHILLAQAGIVDLVGVGAGSELSAVNRLVR